MTYLLGIDPGADCGLAIFDLRDGELAEATTVIINPKDTYGKRMQTLLKTYRELFSSYMPDISVIVWERVPPTSPEILRFYVGCLLAIHPHVKVDGKKHAISPSSWKKMVRDESGCSLDKIKGETALDLVMPGVAEDMMLDHNACDAVLIGLTYLKRNK